MESTDKLLNDREAAALLGVTQSTLNFWRVQRRGPAFVKLGHAVRYRRADIDAYIAASRRETSDSRAATKAAS